MVDSSKPEIVTQALAGISGANAMCSNASYFARGKRNRRWPVDEETAGLWR